jgi:hypothetical protein
MKIRMEATFFSNLTKMLQLNCKLCYSKIHNLQTIRGVMERNHHIHIGWYAEFDRSQRIVNQGVVKHYFCTKSKNHAVQNKVCDLCNGHISSFEEIKELRYPISCQILSQVSKEALDYYTGGRVTLEDLKELEGSMAIFPEFVKTNKEIIFAPGSEFYPLLSKVSGFIDEIDIGNKPSEEWINKIKKVFDVENVVIKYGFAMEVI